MLSLFDLILLCHHLFSAPTFFLPYSTVICVLLSISFHAFLFFLNVLRSEFLYKMIRKIFIWYFYVCPALAIVPFFRNEFKQKEKCMVIGRTFFRFQIINRKKSVGVPKRNPFRIYRPAI